MGWGGVSGHVVNISVELTFWGRVWSPQFLLRQSVWLAVGIVTNQLSFVM